MSHLLSGKINVSVFREDARESLIDFFVQLEGSKVKYLTLFQIAFIAYHCIFQQTLYWEKALMAPFNLIIDISTLKSQKVIRHVEFTPETQLQGITTDHVVFLLRGEIASIESMARAVKDEMASSHGRHFHVILVPRGGLICDQVFTDYGILGDFQGTNSVMELPVIYPLDYDVLSLEMKSSFYEHFVVEDSSMIFDAASAIMRIQSQFGVIPVVRGVGKAARKVFQVMTRLKDEIDENSSQGMNLGTKSKFDYVFIIDRSADLVTPLLCQMSYEGLIDEFFGIKQASVKLPAEKFVSPDSPEKSSNVKKKDSDIKHLTLNSGEELYTKLRDKNFEAVGPYLTTTTKRLQSVKTETGQARSIKELKEIVDKLPYFETAKKSVVNHIAIAELIKSKKFTEDFARKIEFEQDLLNVREYDSEFLEELIYQNHNARDVIRRLCLLSLTKGLKKSALDSFRRELIQSYGIQILPILLNLEACGLLKASSAVTYLPGSQTPYSMLKKTFHLTDPRFKDKFDPQSPNCYHPYEGYLPLSVKLVELLFKNGVNQFNETTKAILSPVFEEVQTQFRNRFSSTASVKSTSNTEEGKTVLVVFLGGCSYSEVSCLRLLSQQEDMNADFVTLTTEFIRGDTLISQFH